MVQTANQRTVRMGGKPNDDMATEGSPNVHNEILIIHPTETIQCDKFKTGVARSCKVRGRVVENQWTSDLTDIMLDSGASFSCISENFMSSLPFKVEVSETLRPSAVDASNRLITAIGDCFLTIVFETTNGSIELRRIRFAIFAGLSVSIIIGCEILSLLDFSLGQKKAKLNNREIPRILSIDKHEILTCNLDLINAIVIEKDNAYETIVEAKIDGDCFASLPVGEYIIHLLDTFTSLAVTSPDKTGRYTSMQFVRTDYQGELKARYFLFSLCGHSSEIPTKLRALVAKIPSVQKSDREDVLVIEESTSRRKCLTDLQLECMLEKSALDKTILRKLVQKFDSIFATSEQDLGEYSEPVQLQLRDPTATPKYCKPRCVPYEVRSWLDDKLQEMIAGGLIELSKGSSFNSPAHIVKKKQPGKYRLTVDYRYLNSQLKQNRWPLPHIRTVLEHLSGSRYFSVMDCRSGFWQLRLTDDSRSMTAFSCRGRQYEWKRLPMGLSVAPGLFQSVMMKVFDEYVFKGIICYVDDILIYSKTKDEHFKLLAKAFARLKEAGVKLHPEKSLFGQTSVEYLGYEIGSFGYKPLKSKIDAILGMTRPNTKTELKSFIGSITFYTQSLPLLQYTLAPLHAISGSTEKFIWGTEQEEAFEKAKAILQGCCPLAFPSNDERDTIYLTTDASDIGYGGVLSEKQANGTEKPLGYFSGTFKAAEKNWQIREKELYSLFFGCNYFYGQLIGRSFTWRTDNKSLSTLADTSLRVKANGIPNSRVIRWFDYLNMFDFNTELHGGTSGEMCLADCLSRLLGTKGDNPHVLLLRMPFWTYSGIPLVEFANAQKSDNDFILRKGIWSRFRGKKYERFFRIRDSIHEYQPRKDVWLVVLPEALLESLFDFYHLPSHNSANKMYDEIKDKFFVPNLMQNIRSYTSKCVKCQQVWAKRKPEFGAIKSTTAPHPWCWGAMDLIGPLPKTIDGNLYILTYVDLFSRWVELRAIPDKTAKSVVTAIDSIFSVRGPCVNLTSDNGREFSNVLVSNYLKDLGVYFNKICPYRPQSNGLCERTNRKVKQSLQFLNDVELTWDRELASIQLGINLQKQSDGLSAFQKLHGWLLYRPAYLACEYKEDEHDKYLLTEDGCTRKMIAKMSKAISGQYTREELQKMSASLGNEAVKANVPIGTRVLVYFPVTQESKLFSNWKGTFVIKEQLDKNTYTVVEESQRRKKYIVDRSRIRLLNTESDDIRKILENEQSELIEVPASGDQPDSERSSVMERPKRKAALIAADKFKEQL